MKKLSIIINGLEYVAKGSENNDLAQAESELSLIKEIAKLHSQIKNLQDCIDNQCNIIEKQAKKINDLDDAYEQFQANVELQLADQMQELRNENNDLELANDRLTGEVQGLSLEINRLEDYIAELEDEAGNMFSKYSELAQVITDIHQTTSGLV